MRIPDIGFLVILYLIVHYSEKITQDYSFLIFRLGRASNAPGGAEKSCLDD